VSHSDPAALRGGGTFQGRYQIVRCIKAGGMGAVYEAIHLETRRRRALKVMLPSMVSNAEMRERFKLEATVAADVDSDHIVEIFDAGIDAETGAPFLVMELLRGEDLTDVLGWRGHLPSEETVHILAQAAKALDKTHAAGIVHRDLKPDNLFLARSDDHAPRLKILDFGIAKVTAQSSQTKSETRSLGTPAYMAPEQLKGSQIGPWTDLYALGQIAYTLLVGEAYWTEDIESQEAIYPLLLRVGSGPADPAAARAWRRQRVTLSPEFEAWFARATAAEPGARFAQASTMIAALAEALGVTAPALLRGGATEEEPTGGTGPSRVRYNPRSPTQSAETVGMPGDDGRGTEAPATSDWKTSAPTRSRKVPLLVAAGVLVTAAAIVTYAAARAPAPSAPRETPVAATPSAPPVLLATQPTPAPPAAPSASTPTPVTSLPASSTQAVSAHSFGAPPVAAKPRKRKDSLGF